MSERKPFAERLAELKGLHAAATPGEWKYRPGELDDWGFIRASANEHGEEWLVAVARAGLYVGEKEMDEHRAHRTDPYRANGEAIAALHNAAADLIARAELLEEIIKDINFKHPGLMTVDDVKILDKYRDLESKP